MSERDENVERITATRESDVATPWGRAGEEGPTGGEAERAAAETAARAGPLAEPWSRAPSAERPAERRAAPAPDDAVPSLAAIRGHPLHPMVVPLPIGALALTAASDIAYAATRDRFFARASRMLTGVGIATGIVAALLGATDFLGRERVREHPEAWLHAAGNLAAVGLSTVSFLMRGRRARFVPAGLILSGTTGAILLVTGWLGGELSYRYRIGVVPR